MLPALSSRVVSSCRGIAWSNARVKLSAQGLCFVSMFFGIPSSTWKRDDVMSVQVERALCRPPLLGQDLSGCS